MNCETLDIYNLDIFKKDKLVVYGAGKYGGLLYLLLYVKGLGDNVACFAVSDKEGNQDTLFEKPVKAIREMENELSDCIVIVAIGATYMDEVLELMEHYVARNVYCVTRGIMENAKKEFIAECGPIKKNKILFWCYNGMGYRCNCKYIAEEFLRSSSPVELVWAVSDESIQDIPESIKKVVKGTADYYIELLTAGVYITNTWHFLYDQKREGQFWINTWHGYGPFKLSAGDVFGDSVWFRKLNAASDLFITASTFYTQIFRNSFFYEGEIMECGAPRNDVFFKENNIKASIYKKLGISPAKKLLLYAPTFREDTVKFFYRYDIDMYRVLEVLGKRFQGEYMLLYRFHHHFNIIDLPKDFYKDGINVTDYPDIQELLVAADVVITDYSSLMWDFSLQRKPVFLYQNDEKDYANERGFYAPISEWPYPKAHTQEELEEIIEEFDNERYLRDLNQFLEKYGSCDDGHAAERVVERIMKEISKGRV